MSVAPWTYDERSDTRISNVRLGMWLFLASEAMFFGSLLSAYVLLRASASTAPDLGETLSPLSGAVNAAFLVAATVVLGTPQRGPTARPFAVWRATVAAAAGAGFVVVQSLEHASHAAAGRLPSTSVLLACWFTLTGIHVLHVTAGVGATLWLMRRARSSTALAMGARLHALQLYWTFLTAVYAAMATVFFLT